MKSGLHKLVLFVAVAVITAFMTVNCLAVDIGSMTWTPRSDWINVKDCVGKLPSFGGTANATGNGTTDDTAALQAVFSYVGPARGYTSPYGHYQTIYFPPGTYVISQTLTIAFAHRIQIVGSGNQTIIKWAGATGGAMFNPCDASNILYRGLTWDGNNIAGCGVLQCSILDSNYDGNIRHENESFRNFTQAGTYAPLGQYGNPASGSVPGAGIAGGFNGQYGDSLEADSMIVNCRFYNCTDGFFNAWAWGNQTEWTIDGCEFESCSGVGIDFHAGGSNTVTNTHFQNNGIDVIASASAHLRHCTSQNSGQFYLEWQGSYTQDSISDCWVDHWTNTDSAIALQDLGGHMVFDCTFTNPPSGAGGAIANHEIWQGTNDQLVLSNNYAPGFANNFGLINANSYNFSPLQIPLGVRFSTITSAAQTFLDSSNFNDGGHIIDVTAAPYNADRSGGTDATSAIQDAIDAAESADNGSIVYLPAGAYTISDALNLDGGNFSFEGSVNTAIFDWDSSGTMLDVAADGSGPINIRSLFMGHSSTATAMVTITATGSTNKIVLTELDSNISQEGNPWVGEPDLDSRGVVCSNLPAGTSVYLDHVLSSLNAEGSSAAQITGRFFQNGQINVSGTSAKTGVIGFASNEGEATPGSSEFTVNVTDNQNLVMEGWYDENNGASVNDFHLTNGSGATPGAVVIQGFNHFSGSGNSQDVSIENYSGLFWLGPQFTATANGPHISQTGSNPVTMIFTAMDFGSSPTFSLASGATPLIEHDYYQNVGDFGGYVANTPNIPTGGNMLSFAKGLDMIRQLDAVDLENRFGIGTDRPPVASYAFENDVTDQAGSNNGTNYNCTFGDGEVGYTGLNMNGGSAYVDLNNPAALAGGTAARSIAGWGKSDSLAGGWRWIAAYGSPAGSQAMFIGMNGTTLYGGGYGDDLSVSNFWDNNWHFIVLTYDGTTAKLYADGNLVASGAKSWNLVKNYAYIGKQVNGGEYWDGSVDQVQFYDYALSAADVGYLYNHERVNTPVAAHWTLDESSGSTSTDSSGNGVTGTWVNSPTFTSDHPSQVSDPDAGSLTFNGSNQYVTLSNLTALPFANAARTMSAWIKTTERTGNHFAVSYGTAATDQAFLIGMEGTTLYGSGYNNDMTVASAITDSNWHHVALTYDGKTESLYLDGQLKTSQVENLRTVPAQGYIGQLVGGAGKWQGSIDDVRIYNRCLLGSEIQQLSGGFDLAAQYNTSSDSTSNLWCYGTYTSALSPSTFTIPSTLTHSSGGGIDCWSFPPSPGGADPNIEKNVTSSAIMGGSADWLPGTVSVGPYQGPAVARFKVPATGHYSITAAFQTDQIRGSETGDGTTGYVYIGTSNVFTQVLSDPGAAQFGTPATYSATNVSLTAGQTVDFVVGNGAFTTQIGATLIQTGP